jgi:arylsulfatase A-like enzyme
MPTERLADRRVRIVAGILVLAAVVRVFADYHDCGLVGWDTYPLILASRLQSPGDLVDLFRDPLMGGDPGLYYRPLLHVSLAIDHALWGLWAPGYHLVDALLYGASALAVFGLALRLLPGSAGVGALVALVFFLVHPVHATVVPVPARRPDMLCLLFMSLSLTAQIRAVEGGRIRPSVVSALLAVLALASKETAFVLPALAFLVALVISRDGAPSRRAAAAAIAALPHACVAIGMLLIRYAVLGGGIGERPLRDEAFLTGTLAMLGDIGVGLVSAHAVVREAEVPSAVVAFFFGTVGASLLLARRERRAAAVAAMIGPLVIASAWVLFVGVIYAVGLLLQPWYLLIPVAGFALLMGAIGRGLVELLREAGWVARGTSVAAALAVGILALHLAAYSPLFRSYSQWERATEVSENYLGRLRAKIVAAPEGTVVRIPPPPLWLPPRPEGPNLLGVVVLAPYTVEAWARLVFPDRRIRRVGAADTGSPAASDGIVLAFGRRSNPSGPDAAGVRRDRPNIVLIVVDDLGYGDLGVHGSRQIRTPHLDALARAGVRFTNGYSSAPMCAPSRAGLLTGRDQNRFGYTGTVGPFRYQARHGIGVPRTEILLSEFLQDAGYATAAVGKWHLGVNPPFRPLARGFDAFFGHLGGAHRYFHWGHGLFGPVFRNDTAVRGSEYLTQAFTREAVVFIESHREKPFFLYLAHTAIHVPHEAPEHHIAAYATLQPKERRVVAGMMRSLDEGIGQVLQALKAQGIEDDTLVIFLSDNGGFPPASSNAPFRGGKGSLLEGGIRVPFFAKWPRVLAAGQVYEPPVSALDVFPTVLAAAGLDPPPDRALDGVNLLPHLTAETAAVPHPALYWRMGDQVAIRRGPLKLVRYWREETEPVLTEYQLFDLSQDPAETRELSRQRPKLARQLAGELESWMKTLPPTSPTGSVVWDGPPPSSRPADRSGEVTESP